MSNATDDHYRAVLADLQAERKRVSAQLAQVEADMAVIERIRARANGQSTEAPALPRASKEATVRLTNRSAIPINFATMSVRWAVLAFLAEVATGPMGSGAIANALAERGLEKQGPSRFGNVVSAVISNLKAKGEVESVDGGLYQLTEAGRAMWAHIRASAKFRIAQGIADQDALPIEVE